MQVVNTGLHYSATYEQDLQELVHWWRQHRKAVPFLVWKDTPTQHFDQVCFAGRCRLSSPLMIAQRHTPCIECCLPPQ